MTRFVTDATVYFHNPNRTPLEVSNFAPQSSKVWLREPECGHGNLSQQEPYVDYIMQVEAETWQQAEAIVCDRLPQLVLIPSGVAVDRVILIRTFNEATDTWEAEY